MQFFTRIVLTVCWVIGGVVLAGMVAEAQEKLPIPSMSLQKPLREAAWARYGTRLRAAHTNMEKSALAREMFEAALYSRNNPINQYVLFDIAKNLAVSAGDTETAARATDALAQKFEMEVVVPQEPSTENQPVIPDNPTTTASPNTPSQEKNPIPDAEVQSSIRKMAGEVYGERFREAKTPADKSALGKEIFLAATRTKEGTVDQYVLFDIAKSMAVGAGDFETALKTVDQLSLRFDVPSTKLKVSILETVAPKVTGEPQNKVITEVATGLLDTAKREDDYETAIKLCGIAEFAAKKSKQYDLAKDLSRQTEDLKILSAADQEYREAMLVLEKEPFDAKANLTAGRYLFFIKKDWEHGLPKLAAGDDEELSDIATQDLKKPTAPEEQVALGDAWWDLAETKEDPDKKILLSRSSWWYRQAEPKLDGVLQLKVGKRLEELRQQGIEVSINEAEKPASAPPGQQIPIPGLQAPLVNAGPEIAVVPFDSQKAAEYQSLWSKHLKLPVAMTNSLGMKFVLIPPGEFMMGITPEEANQLLTITRRLNPSSRDLTNIPRAVPKHMVKITEPFYLGMYEVTQSEYQRTIGTNPSQRKDSLLNPVESVTWNDAVGFCRRLSELPQEKTAGRTYDLPTEAMWEYACRAGTATSYAFGDNVAGLNYFAWWKENSPQKHQPVGRLKPNAWGLFDMHGNVSEWCLDWYDDNYYSVSRPENPTGASFGATRVCRGGSYIQGPESCLSAFRRSVSPTGRGIELGFRIMMPVPVANDDGTP